MEEKKKLDRKILYSIIAVAIIVVIIIGASVAYFSSLANTQVQEITTGNISLNFANGDIIRADYIVPIKENQITSKATELPFTITNDGDQSIKVKISLTDIDMRDELKSEDFRWGIYEDDTLISSGNFFHATTSMDLVTGIDIPATNPDTTKSYKLRVWIYDTGLAQNILQGKTFEAKVKVTTINNLATNTLAYNIINRSAVLGSNNYNYDWCTADGEEKITGYNYDWCTVDGQVKVTEWNYGDVNANETCTNEDDVYVYYNGNPNSEFCKNPPQQEDYDNYDDYISADDQWYYECAEQTGTCYATQKSTCVATKEICSITGTNTSGIEHEGYAYYYKGNPVDNYVSFGGQTWRILNISATGNIRLVNTSKQFKVYNATFNSCSEYSSNFALLNRTNNMSTLMNNMNTWIDSITSDTEKTMIIGVDSLWNYEEEFKKNYIEDNSYNYNTNSIFNDIIVLSPGACYDDMMCMKGINGDVCDSFSPDINEDGSKEYNIYEYTIPLLTLKPGVTVSQGTGTSADPYVIQ